VLVLASDVVWVAAISGGVPAIAAIIVAVVTAKTTNKRQERQLSAAAERDQRQLDAREAEQTKQLAHDRGLADLADLRALLDKAASALFKAHPAELVSLRLSSGARRLDQKQMIEAATDRLDELQTRLSVRLGARDEVTLLYGNAIQALRAIADQIPRDTGADTDEMLAARERIMAGAMEALVENSDLFIAAAVRRVGTRPEVEEPDEQDDADERGGVAG
jgi:hypothetical protein